MQFDTGLGIRPRDAGAGRWVGRTVRAMVVALGVAVALFIAVLLVGAVTGRVNVRSCCAVADPRRDLRMRAAFTDEVITGSEYSTTRKERPASG